RSSSCRGPGSSTLQEVISAIVATIIASGFQFIKGFMCFWYLNRKTPDWSNTPIGSKKKRGAMSPSLVFLPIHGLSDRYPTEFGHGQAFAHAVQILRDRLRTVLYKRLSQEGVLLEEFLQLTL